MSTHKDSINVWENEGGSVDERTKCHERNNKLIQQSINKYQWQYESGDGWGNFDPEANKKMESLNKDYFFDERKSYTKIKSGKWEYFVDFDTYRQTNIQHSNHRTRKIRQVTLL